MLVSVLFLTTVFHAGYAGYASGVRGCDVDYPIKRGTMRLPRGREILSLRDFDDKIVGEVLHGFITGVSSTRSGTMVEKIELVFTRPNENKVGFNFKAVINGRCVDGSVFNNNEFDLIEGGRAEFKVPATGGVYSVLFSSNPESYVWNLLCFGGQVDGIPRCRAEDLLVTLYTLENPPNNINLEMMGRDLRLRTCLSMQEITDVYMFTFIQGNNTCPDNGV